MRRIRFRWLALVALGGVVSVVRTSVHADPKDPAEELAGMAQPEYDEKGALLRPSGFERWTFVGTSLGLDYSKDADQKKGPGDFHNVYVQPQAFDHFVKRGEFPEKTIFVMTNSPAKKKEGDASINQRGHFAGQPTGLEVSVKDSARFEDGWAYYIFRSASGSRSSARPFPRQVCWNCHAEHARDDNVFTQFYSVLDGLRPKRAAAAK